MKNYVYLVMLILGMMLTACEQERDDKDYGNELTLDKVSVFGNIASVALSNGDVRTLSLDSVKAENAEIVLTDTIQKTWSELGQSAVRCEGFNIVYRSLKDRKGNFFISEALCQTYLVFDELRIPVMFWHDVVGVIDANGTEQVRVPKISYQAGLDAVETTLSENDDAYCQAGYRLLIKASDADIPIGTIDFVLYLYAKSGKWHF